MRRWQEEAAHTKREHVKHLRQAHGWPAKPVDCICDLQAGRFRKSKGLGCRKKDCLVCKWEKVLKIPTKRDLVEQDRTRDSFADLT